MANSSLDRLTLTMRHIVCCGYLPTAPEDRADSIECHDPAHRCGRLPAGDVIGEPLKAMHLVSQFSFRRNDLESGNRSNPRGGESAKEMSGQPAARTPSTSKPVSTTGATPFRPRASSPRRENQGSVLVVSWSFSPTARRRWPLRHVPIGRGCRAEGTVPENPEPD